MTASVNDAPGLPDILAPNLRVVFCGINPGLTSAALGRHFAGRSNRFWKTLHLAGFTREEIAPENGRLILSEGCGLTTAVARPTARADELSLNEFERAALGLSAKMARYSPKYVAFLGKAAFAAIFERKLVEWGKQDGCLEDRRHGSCLIPAASIVPSAWINWFALTASFALPRSHHDRIF